MKRLILVTAIAAWTMGCSQTGNRTERATLEATHQDFTQPDSTTKALPPREMVFAGRAGKLTDTNSLSGYMGVRRYRVGMGEKQTLEVKQVNIDASKLISLKILSPTRENVGGLSGACNNSLKVSPTTAGIYTLEVTACLKVDEWAGEYMIQVSAE